jgi:uncharacterized protein (DUF697 family)
MLDNVKGAFGIWNVVRGITSADIRRQMEVPVSVILVGNSDELDRLSRRLGSPSPVQNVLAGDPIVVGDGQIIFDAGRLNSLSESDFAAELSKIAAAHSDQSIALAYNVPAFRPIIIHQLSHTRAFENAKVAAVSALPGVIPLTDWLMPATAAGDMLILTRNQIVLLLEVAACYGRPPETKARIKELLPIVGTAFGWRAVARELVGLVPGGVGVVIKAALAYAGTYSVGRAAAFYYSGGGVRISSDQMGTFYKGALVEGFTRAKTFLSGT